MMKSAWYVASFVLLTTLSFRSSAQSAPTTQVMSGSNPKPQVMSGSNPKPQVMSGSNPKPQVIASPMSTAVSAVLSLLGVYTF